MMRNIPFNRFGGTSRTSLYTWVSNTSASTCSCRSACDLHIDHTFSAHAEHGWSTCRCAIDHATHAQPDRLRLIMLTPQMLLQLLVGLPLEMAEPGWKGTARFVYEFDFIYNVVVTTSAY